MRSRIKTSIIVLLVASATGSTAMAATTEGNTINHVADPNVHVAAVKVVQTEAKAREPRLTRIMAELQMQNRRLNRDHRKGLLTAANYQQLRSERNQIRVKAMRVADRHAGKIPLRPYVALQASIRALNTNIRHSLTV